MAEPVCSSCGAEIKWVTLLTLEGGQLHPVDFDPCEMPEIGMLAVRRRELEGWVALVITKDVAARRMEELLTKGATFHKSHFATCPDADEHRRKVHPEQVSLDV